MIASLCYSDLNKDLSYCGPSLKNHWMQSCVNDVNWMLCRCYDEALLRKACLKPSPVYMRRKQVWLLIRDLLMLPRVLQLMTSDPTFSLSSERMCIYLPDIHLMLTCVWFSLQPAVTESSSG